MNEKSKVQVKRENSLATSFDRSMSSIIFNLKFTFSNKKILAIVASFYLITITLPSVFLPISLSGGAMMLIGVMLPGLIILGSLGSNLKKSTLYKNVLTTGIKRRAFYVSQLITIVIIVNIISIVMWTIVWFFGNFNFFLAGWVWEKAGRMKVNPFSHWTWITILYITNVTSLLIFSVYFLIDSFTHDIKTYNIVVSCLLIIGFIFGGSMNTYFSKPLHYEFYDWSTTGGIAGYDYIWPAGSETILVREGFWLNNDITMTSMNENGIEVHGALFPTFMFIPTLIFNPFYAVGEFSSCAITKNMCQEQLWNIGQQVQIVADVNVPGSAIGTYSLFPETTLSHVSIWSWFSINFADGSWRWTLILAQPFITMFAYIGIGSVVRIYKRK